MMRLAEQKHPIVLKAQEIEIKSIYKRVLKGESSMVSLVIKNECKMP